ncbi:hypothetical protein ACQKNC_10800 [Lysinibacillus sp. NPDC094177]|uniref:hypothetical protein n=1 Tax=Lysinibacillus sp. NPDC094177 TaxID=3390580 RepID=UPI003D020AD5
MFQFILADAAAAKTIEGLLLLEVLAVGGMLVMDDFTPEEHFPEEWRGKPDKVRDFWLNQKELRATEILFNTNILCYHCNQAKWKRIIIIKNPYIFK